MAEIVESLFGINPTALQQQRQRQAFSQDYQAVQLDPLQQANLALRQGGRGFAGLLGAEDPELAKARQATQLASQFDLTTAEGLREYARALQSFAPELAVRAAAEADKRAISAATVTQKTRESIKQVGQTPDGRQVYQQGDTQYLLGEGGQRIPYYGRLESKTPKQEINVTAKGEGEFVKKLATLDAKRVDEAATARDNAIAGLNNLNQLANLNEQELIGGAFATTRVGAVNFLNTLGLVGERDVQRLSASEQYAKTASDLVLQTLGGRLGAGFSNEDRKFIERIVPQLENSADARRQLITFMQTKFTNIVNEADRLENYARDNNSLKGYKYTTPIPKAAPSKSQYTRAELEAELQRRTQGNK